MMVDNIYTMECSQLDGQYSDPHAFKPVVILHPLKRGTEYSALASPVGDYETFYAERAVPYPTIAEATGQFPSKEEVARLNQALAATPAAPAAATPAAPAAAAGT